MDDADTGTSGAPGPDGTTDQHRQHPPPPYDPDKEGYAGISTGPLHALGDLHDARDFAEMIVDTVREGLLVLDLGLRVVAANESFYRAFAVRPEETVGRLVYDLGDGQWDAPELRELLEGVLPHNKVVNDYDVERDFEGVGRRAVVLNARRLDEHELILLAIEDVTERRERVRAEADAERDRRHLQALFEHALDAFLLADDEGRYVEANPAACELLGFTVEELRARSVWDLTPQGVNEDGRAHWQAFVAAGQQEGEYVLMRKGGTPVSVEFRATADIVPGLHLSVLRDVTERKRAEEALRESEARFRLMADAVPQIVWITDAEGRAEFFNRQWTAYTGREYEPTTAAEVAATAVHPDDAGVTMERFEEARRSGGTFHVEHRIRSAAGEYRWFLVRAEPYRDPESDRISRWFGASVDIHDRKLAEQALQESEARYRALFHQAPAVIAMLRGPEHRYEFVNPAYLRLVGDRELLGKAVREALPELEGQWLFEVLDRVYERGEPFTAVDRPVDLQRSSGGAVERRYVNFVYQPLREPDGSVSGVIALGVDTTERVRAREERDRAQRELEEANRELERRVEARTRQVRRLASKLSVAEQEERRRIAHVLHDDLQQQLFGVSIALSLLTGAASPEERARLAERAGQTLAEATKLTRTLSTELSPAVLESDRLGEVLRWLAVQQREAHGIDVEVEGDADVGTPVLRLLLYHFVREALFNVAKHAGTNRARVVIEGVDGHVAIRIEDEGAGFDTAALEGGTMGFGLASIRERLELMGGRLKVASAAGRGTRVTVTVPVQPA